MHFLSKSSKHNKDKGLEILTGPHYMKWSNRVLVCEEDDDQTNKKHKLWPHYVIGVFSNLLLKIKGNYPAPHNIWFSSPIIAPRSVTTRQLLFFLPILVCLFHFLIHFVLGFTFLLPVSLYFQSFICSHYLTHYRTSRSCKKILQSKFESVFSATLLLWYKKKWLWWCKEIAACNITIKNNYSQMVQRYFTQEILQEKHPQHMEYESNTKEAFSEMCWGSVSRPSVKEKNPVNEETSNLLIRQWDPARWSEAKIKVWGTMDSKVMERANCKTGGEWRMGHCAGKHSEMNCHKKLDGNGSKIIKARCESLLQCSFFRGSTAEAYKQFFKCGFALNEPWMAIKTAMASDRSVHVCPKLMSIICTA